MAGRGCMNGSAGMARVEAWTVPAAPQPGRPLPARLAAAALGGLLGIAALAATLQPAAADVLPDPRDWPAVLAAAEGQTVRLHAWGGDPKINAYLDWAADELAGRHGITLLHVKLAATSEAVAQVLADKLAGRDAGGPVDAVWINGENFRAMKEAGLLFGPFAEDLPNFRYVDVEGKPTTVLDFTVPTEGMEAPWGMAQLVFYADTARVETPPRSLEALAAWAAENPGRFTYPAPPDFTGTTFLKQILVTRSDDPASLQQPPPGEDAAVEALLAPLWDYLDRLHPHLWRQGRTFPSGYPALRQLVDDGETAIGFAFNPSEASSAIAQGLLPETVRAFVLEGGSLGNTHFLAIPFNASAKEGAMVAIDFLMSPEAQHRKADPEVWGDPTVLDLEALPAADRAAFDALPLGPADLDPAALGPILPEPHPDWVAVIEREWARRHAN